MSLVLLQCEENKTGSYFETWTKEQRAYSVLYIHLTPWKLFSGQCLNEYHIEEYFCGLQIVKYFECSSKNIKSYVLRCQSPQFYNLTTIYVSFLVVTVQIYKWIPAKYLFSGSSFRHFENQIHICLVNDLNIHNFVKSI